MILNPFYLILFIYFSANTYAFIRLQMFGGFEVFGYFREISQLNSALAYLLQLFFLAIIFLFYKNFLSEKHRSLRLGNGWGGFVLLLTVSFFVFNQVTGAGRAGSGFTFDGYNPVNIFFIFLQPDVIVLLVAPFLASNKIFWFVLSAYFISLISRGWMGSVLFVFIIYLIRYYPVRFKIVNSLYFISFSAFVFFLLPLLDALKWGMRSGLELNEIFPILFDSDYWGVLNIVLFSVVERFQHLNYAAYVVENSSVFLDDLFSGQFLWFFQAGIFNSVYCNLFGCPVDFTVYVAESLYGKSGLSWNVDPGLAGWAHFLGYFSVLFIFFILFLLFLSFRLFSFTYGRNGIFLVSCFCLLYLFNGWLGAFYNFVIYAFILSYLFRVRF